MAAATITRETLPGPSGQQCPPCQARAFLDLLTGIGRQVKTALVAYEQAAETRDGIEHDRVHEASVYPELAGRPEAKRDAVALASQEADEAEAALIRALAVAAALVRGQMGGRS